jgi:hypothetical protein
MKYVGFVQISTRLQDLMGQPIRRLKVMKCDHCPEILYVGCEIQQKDNRYLFQRNARHTFGWSIRDDPRIRHDPRRDPNQRKLS